MRSIIDFFKKLFGIKDKEVVSAVIIPKIETPLIVEPEKLQLPGVSGTVRSSAQGEDAKTVQKALLAKGYDLGLADGIFGSRSVAALKKFQADNGLVADGIAGALTLAKLGVEIKAPAQSIETGTLQTLASLGEDTLAFHQVALPLVQFDPGYETKAMNEAKKLKANEVRYEEPMLKLGFPKKASDGFEIWKFAAAMHDMECGGDFSKQILNGESIHIKTTLVPKGEGPFANFEASVYRGMELKKITPANYPDMTRAMCALLAQRWNGLGYVNGAGKEQVTPYVYAQTNISKDFGKYTADGKYSSTASANGQTGCAAIWKALDILEGKASVTVISTESGGTTWFTEIKKYSGKVESDSSFQSNMNKYWGPMGLSGFKGLVGSARAWCGLLVFAGMYVAGYQTPKGAASAKSWDNFGQKIDWRSNGFPMGAVVRINHKADCSSSSDNHVTTANGDCAPQDLKSGTFSGYGGNQSDTAKVSNFPVSHICTVTWPKEIALPVKVTQSKNCSNGQSSNESTK